MAKILLVEDDEALASTTQHGLTVDYHNVEMVHTGTEGLQWLRTYGYDVVILDWELPGLTGIEVLRHFRAGGGTTPILMLTGKDTIGDKETGFDAGADDYLTKPFDIRELRLRISALLRRPQVQPTAVLSLGPLTLDPTKYLVTAGKEIIKVSPTEFALLEFLMRHPNQLISAETIINRVWPAEKDATVETLRTSVKRLRNKIDCAGVSLKAVYGMGYKLELGQNVD